MSIRFRSFYEPRMFYRAWRIRIFPCGLKLFKHNGWRQFALIQIRAGWRHWSLQLEVAA